MNQTLRKTRRVRRRWQAALALVVVAPFALACDSTTEPLTTLWETTLNPVAGNRVSGQAAAVTQFGRTTVSVEVRLADPEVQYPWRVESGTCTSSGVIQGGAAQYLPIDTDDAGSGEGVAQIAVQFRPGDKVAVKIFAPGSGSGQEMVACGVLEQV